MFRPGAKPRSGFPRMSFTKPHRHIVTPAGMAWRCHLSACGVKGHTQLSDATKSTVKIGTHTRTAKRELSSSPWPVHAHSLET